MTTLAEKLKTARNKKKLSMTAVAHLSQENKDPRGKITQSYLSRLESGKETNPSFLKIMTLCKVYMIKPGSLF